MWPCGLIGRVGGGVDGFCLCHHSRTPRGAGSARATDRAVNPSELGAHVRRQRLLAGYTQEQLAAKSGLSVRAISDFERGRTHRPYPRSIELLAAALGLSADAAQQWTSSLRAERAAETVGAVSAAEYAPNTRFEPVPRQLPAAIPYFTGRAEQVAGLVREATGGARTRGSAGLSLIFGTAGIGKTALAVHVAHQLATSFPDGQLYVNLRGFDPARAPMRAAEAVRLMLDAFAVPAERVPADLDAQIGLYRSLLAGKRVLVVLDNAVAAHQVRPLLPGDSACLTLVTSRNLLSSLIALDGATPMPVDLLTATEARVLLTEILGPARADAEPQAVERLGKACGRLPLALALTAARAATRPHLQLTALADALADTTGRLDLLQTADDPLTSVRAALACSHAHLDASAARFFRLLSVHPGPDLAAAAAASLAGLSRHQAALQAAELTDANLIVQDAAGRFTMHDLVRLYAAERFSDTEPEVERAAATRRLLDHYVHTGFAAALLLRPFRDPIDLAPPADAVIPEALADYGQALSWFDAEHRALSAAVENAAAAGLDRQVWNIAWTLRDYFYYRGYWTEQVAVDQAALAAARRLGDPALEGRSHYYLACGAAAHLGRYDDARSHHERALELFRGLGDRTWQAHAHLGLAGATEAQGRHEAALGQCRRALALYTATDDEVGRATALNMAGWTLIQLGRCEEALIHCEDALARTRKLADRYAEGETLDSLGYAYHRLGRFAEAVDSYLQSLEVFRELGHRYKQTETLTNLGDTHLAAGDLRAARAAWTAALAVLDALEHRAAEHVRAKLQAVGIEAPEQ